MPPAWLEDELKTISLKRITNEILLLMLMKMMIPVTVQHNLFMAMSTFLLFAILMVKTLAGSAPIELKT